MGNIAELRADYDAKWQVYQDARVKALRQVEHLRQESSDAYLKLRAAWRAERNRD